MKRFLPFLAIVAICLLGTTSAQAIEKLGPMSYQIIGQSGAWVPKPGVDLTGKLPSIWASAGETVEITVDFRPFGGEKSQIFYPWTELLHEPGVKHAHAIILESINNDFVLDPDSYGEIYTEVNPITKEPMTLKAVGIYEGPQLRSGASGQITGRLKLRDDLEPGQYLLYFSLHRIYDGAQRVDESGKPDYVNFITWELHIR